MAWHSAERRSSPETWPRGDWCGPLPTISNMTSPIISFTGRRWLTSPQSSHSRNGCSPKLAWMVSEAGSSLPLDRARRLRGDVVHDAVDPLHLVDDARRHVADEFHVEGIEVGAHPVGRGHRAQPDDVIVGAIIAHDADGAHGQQHGERLPNVVVEPGAADLLDIDVIGAAQDIELFPRDVAGAADGEPGPGKRVSADEGLR